MAVKLGIHAKLTVGGTEVHARDVTVNLETSDVDVTTRNSQGWKATATALKDASIEFETLAEQYDTYMQAFLDGTPLQVSAMDAQSGGHGLTGHFIVTNVQRSEPLDGPITVRVTMKAYSDDTVPPPQWV